ncbi:MAG: hypothetical protein WBX25_36635 [Rhodomicrobium sp.]
MVDSGPERPGDNSTVPSDWDPPVDPAALERAMQRVPLGAFAVAGITVLLLLAGYLYVYLFIFLPRGTVS